ncbi:MAG: group II intron reverse transcriptase/maturase [Candidatus Methanoperedens sp.]|nr:group II intron reverse transcriptase/maturase [Candidatus Methanoperedens sp.]
MRHTSQQETLHEFQVRLFKEAKSNPGKKFNNIHHWLWDEEVLTLAWESVKKNKGVGGVDNLNIDDIESHGVTKFLNNIRFEIKNGSYEPSPVKRVYIPKSNGRLRPLGIATIKDRVAQTAVKLVIEPIFEAGFEEFSYGFRPDRSTKNACTAVCRWLNAGCVNVFDADIVSCFDSIPHNRLMEQVKRRFADTYILSLIDSWLCAGILEKGKLHYTDKGTPQGGVISPLLSNIYLDQFDKKWKINETGVRKKAHLVRYADDFVILSEGLISFEPVKKILNSLELRVNREKTRILHAKNGFDFLGFHFKLIRQQDKQKAAVTPTSKSLKKVIEKINELTGENNFHVPPERLIIRINQVLSSWASYYSDTGSSGAMKHIQDYCEECVRNCVQCYKGVPKNQISDKYLHEELGLVRIV